MTISNDAQFSRKEKGGQVFSWLQIFPGIYFSPLPYYFSSHTFL